MIRRAPDASPADTMFEPIHAEARAGPFDEGQCAGSVLASIRLLRVLDRSVGYDVNRKRPAKSGPLRREPEGSATAG